jgi:hypothetical protein
MIAKRASLFFVFLFTAGIVWAADDSKPLALSDLPAAVQKTITSQIGDGQLGGIDKSKDDNESIFDVDFTTKAGDDRDFTVADDGTLLSMEVAFSETPVAVQKTIQQAASGWVLESIDKNLDDTEVSYDVETTRDGREEKFTVAEDGDTLSEQVPLTNTPAVVQTAIAAKVADGRVISVNEIFQPDGSSFDVEVEASDGAHNSFSVSAAGKLLSEEVALAKLSPGARKTIATKIGDGKILRVDKSLSEKKDGVLPYQVQGRKDGKSFDFSVGPRGRFLGMDN